MLVRLALLLILIPLLELAVLIWIGRRVGVVETIAMVLVVGFLGAWLARRQGTQAVKRIQESMRLGVMPGPDLLDGTLILLAAILLATPGLITDAIGLALLVPPVRNWVARQVGGYLLRRLRIAPAGPDHGTIDAQWREVGGRGPT